MSLGDYYEFKVFAKILAVLAVGNESDVRTKQYPQRMPRKQSLGAVL